MRSGKLFQGRKKRARGSNPMPLKVKQKKWSSLFLFHRGCGEPNRSVPVSKITKRRDNVVEDVFALYLVLLAFSKVKP